MEYGRLGFVYRPAAFAGGHFRPFRCLELPQRLKKDRLLSRCREAGAGRTDNPLQQTCLDDLEALVDEIVPATELVHYALTLAVDAAHPAYDTLFVALADSRDTVVVTFDRQMRQRFQDRVLLVDEFLSHEM